MKEIVFNVDEQNYFAMDGLQWELVRCKDCKHYKRSACSNPSNKLNPFARMTNPDWFCADGEKQTD